MYVIRKPGEGFCPGRVQEARPASKKDETKVHCWGAMENNFRSPLIRYYPQADHGATSHAEYVKILNQEVLYWPTDAALEEDGASDHGRGQNSEPLKWKKEHHPKHCFKSPYSPDLALIENAWKAPKEALKKLAHWDEETVWEVAQVGWEGLTRKTINEGVDSMPKRSQAVIDGEGKLTAF
jgi:transposase